MTTLPNAKHEHFAQLIANGVNATEAAKTAGYSEKRAAITGCELLKDRNISVRISDLRVRISDRVIEKTAYGLAEAMREAEEARVFAVSLKNPNAVLLAVSLKAKLNGLLIDRKEIRTGPLESSTDDELDRIIRGAAAEAQVSFGVAGEGSETQH